MTELLPKEITKQIVVATTRQKAFALFTQGIGDWWPVASHSLSAGENKMPLAVTMTSGIGGVITETLYDGTTARWGVITAWEPGEFLAFTWHLRRPESQQTLVTIRFSTVKGGTCVTLVHSNWAVLGLDAETIRNQYNAGWDYVLADCFANAVSQTTNRSSPRP